jgi:hypothetical protein
MAEQYIRLRIPADAVNGLGGVPGMPAEQDGMVLRALTGYPRLRAENRELKAAREQDEKLIGSLKKELEQGHAGAEELGRANKDLIEKLAALKVEYHLMEKKVEYLEANPKVEEKIVYRENNDTLNALKKKRDELQQAVWEKEDARRRLSEENAGLKSSLAKLKKDLEDSSRGHFAVLITRRGAVSGPMELEGIEAKMIDSAAYYLLKADEAEFRRMKGVKGQMLVLPLEEMKRQG